MLDPDLTDTPLHGRQESRFLPGFYNTCRHLPLCDGQAVPAYALHSLAFTS